MEVETYDVYRRIFESVNDLGCNSLENHPCNHLFSDDVFRQLVAYNSYYLQHAHFHKRDYVSLQEGVANSQSTYLLTKATETLIEFLKAIPKR